MADSDATKRALLTAGRAEFARSGLAGGRIDRIAAEAGVNKQRIYAYYGSKNGLFSAVLAEALNDLLEVVPFPEVGPPEQMIADYVETVGRYHRENPEFLRLLLWEALEAPESAGASADRVGKYREKVDGFAMRFQLPHPDAAQLLLGAIGLAAWPNAVPQLTALILADHGPDPSSQAAEWAGAAAAAIVQPGAS
ncbi:TetR/AcrR family transcriptional regulator [Nesterenkonia ebinurensis]|uniref:TetR/AcrR family transcriptional regulator n=1 Tax=Nesterenkonia ebinurensis TaxID=2608252 RepID=UPI00123CDDCC|nr:TetR/AcrR family transcriptional regulator [Nesterenkonia ebinurensis]